MRYEDMPKGRNKDRCVRCGKRYNFADKALSKAKVPYDLLCLAEVTTSGYMTHGNVKLCDECMVELLMWLDHKTENSSEKPNNCEHITEDGVTCAKYPACDDCLDNPLNKLKGSERLVKGSEQTDLVEDSPSLVKDLVKAFGEDGTWLERQGVYTLTLAEAKQRAVDIIESVLAKDEPTISKMEQVDKDINVRSKDEPQTERSE